ncbi:MAG: class I SAM-dependent methyltransferase [Clostridium perfringens]|nr:class I SAM-dependent methyltransferase [Clostridium perfringens]
MKPNSNKISLLYDIEKYWTSRTEGYNKVNVSELNSHKKDLWKDIVETNSPNINNKKIKVLDIGTGPGFFAILTSSLGYDVTSIDYTESMLEKAKSNADIYLTNHEIKFIKMDGQNLNFQDETFDLIVSRNLTWNLENPAKAYYEWFRVLKKGGRLINFDANWYLHLFDKEKRKAYESDRINVKKMNLNDHYTCTDIDEMEKIARKLPLSQTLRPNWDKKILHKIGFKFINIDRTIGDLLWSDEEKINYNSTPMFMIVCEK